MVSPNSPFSPTRFGGQSFAPLMAMNIVTKLFEGSRNLWRQRFLVDIAIFQHEKVVMMKEDQPVYNPFCVEIIIFNPSIGAEAPHLYLSHCKLCKKFKRSGTFLGTGTVDLIVEFVLNRVGVVTPTENCSDQEYSFDVMLMPLEDDADDDESCIMARPRTLAELPTTQRSRCPSLRFDESRKEFDKKITQFRLDALKTNIACDKADQLSAMTGVAMQCYYDLRKKLLINEKDEGGEGEDEGGVGRKGGKGYSKARKLWIKATRQVIKTNKMNKQRNTSHFSHISGHSFNHISARHSPRSILSSHSSVNTFPAHSPQVSPKHSSPRKKLSFQDQIEHHNEHDSKYDRKYDNNKYDSNDSQGRYQDKERGEERGSSPDKYGMMDIPSPMCDRTNVPSSLYGRVGYGRNSIKMSVSTSSPSLSEEDNGSAGQRRNVLPPVLTPSPYSHKPLVALQRSVSAKGGEITSPNTRRHSLPVMPKALSTILEQSERNMGGSERNMGSNSERNGASMMVNERNMSNKVTVGSIVTRKRCSSLDGTVPDKDCAGGRENRVDGEYNEGGRKSGNIVFKESVQAALMSINHTMHPIHNLTHNSIHDPIHIPIHDSIHDIDNRYHLSNNYTNNINNYSNNSPTKLTSLTVSRDSNSGRVFNTDESPRTDHSSHSPYKEFSSHSPYKEHSLHPLHSPMKERSQLLRKEHSLSSLHSSLKEHSLLREEHSQSSLASGSTSTCTSTATSSVVTSSRVTSSCVTSSYESSGASGVTSSATSSYNLSKSNSRNNSILPSAILPSVLPYVHPSTLPSVLSVLPSILQTLPPITAVLPPIPTVPPTLSPIILHVATQTLPPIVDLSGSGESVRLKGDVLRSITV